MTWDQRTISVFLATAEAGSLGRAAREVNLTQPAVTRIIRRLEAHLGAPLFDRTTTGVTLNVYGKALLPYATLVSAEMANAEKLLDALRGASRGVVRVGGVGSVTSGHLAAALQRLLETQPGLQALVVEEIEDKLLNALKHGEIDLAVSPEPYLDEEIALACPEGLHDEVEVFGSPDHPLARARDVTLAEVARHPWALPPQDTPVTRELRRRFFARGIDTIEVRVVSRSVNMLKSMTAKGGLMCWMPRGLVTLELAAGELVALPIPELRHRRTFHVYRRRMGQLPPAAVQLLRALQQLAREETR
ncbi:LysR family transcriptional regulator [Plastorhodobacter daqingensis]|uniref:LysR family transcriptional regulator n=1 Tax=Plastorhodobacter daqingensis TaxID=1387281 RepID=A0ABW2ULU2_9RHOB